MDRPELTLLHPLLLVLLLLLDDRRLSSLAVLSERFGCAAAGACTGAVRQSDCSSGAKVHRLGAAIARATA